MTREEIEKAAERYDGIGFDAMEKEKLHDLNAFCWTTNELIDFAIQQVNAALEDAAMIATEESAFMVARLIGERKVKP